MGVCGYSITGVWSDVCDHADDFCGGVSDFYPLVGAGAHGMFVASLLLLNLALVVVVLVAKVSGDGMRADILPWVKWLLPKYFEDSELRILDAPTASPFTMISVGGNYGESEEEDGVVGSGQETAVQSGLQSGMGSDGEGVLVGGSECS